VKHKEANQAPAFIDLAWFLTPNPSSFGRGSNSRPSDREHLDHTTAFAVVTYLYFSSYLGKRHETEVKVFYFNLIVSSVFSQSDISFMKFYLNYSSFSPLLHTSDER